MLDGCWFIENMVMILTGPTTNHLPFLDTLQSTSGFFLPWKTNLDSHWHFWEAGGCGPVRALYMPAVHVPWVQRVFVGMFTKVPAGHGTGCMNHVSWNLLYLAGHGHQHMHQLQIPLSKHKRSARFIRRSALCFHDLASTMWYPQLLKNAESESNN